MGLITTSNPSPTPVWVCRETFLIKGLEGEAGTSRLQRLALWCLLASDLHLGGPFPFPWGLLAQQLQVKFLFSDALHAGLATRSADPSAK